MTKAKINGALLALVLAVSAAAPVLARGNDLVIKDGLGEEITIKNGWFGRKTRVVKDRLGNTYESKKGLFGTADTEVSVLGNTLKKKKGLFGGSDIEGSTILGDKVTTKKGIFGRRTTTVDMSGIASVIGQFVKSKSSGGNPAKDLLNSFTGNSGADSGNASADPSNVPASDGTSSSTF